MTTRTTRRTSRLEDDAMYAGFQVKIYTYLRKRAGSDKYYEFIPIGEDKPMHTVKGTKMAEAWLAGYVAATERLAAVVA